MMLKITCLYRVSNRRIHFQKYHYNSNEIQVSIYNQIAMSSGLRSFAVVIKSRKLISLRQNVHSNRQKPNNCGFVVNENFIQHMHILFGLQSLSNQNQIKNDLFAFYYLRVPELIVVSVRSCFWDWLSASAKKNQPGNAASSSFQSFFFFGYQRKLTQFFFQST